MTRKDKIKAHFEDHKQFYVGLGIGLGLAGITWVIVKERYATLTDSVDGRECINAPVTVRSFSFLSNPSNTVVNTVHSGHRGHPGFPVRNLETGVEFATQADAAKAFGISQRSISQHLNGKRVHAEDLHFERITP